jgi:hypothetical protein
VHRVEEFADRIPGSWRQHDAVFVPLYQREALWIGFDGRWWHPNAMTIAAGRVNVMTGEVATESLSREPQDYIVIPDQPWLDGFHLEPGVVRQFVAAPLGWSTTVAEQLGSTDQDALWLRIFEAVPGRFPEQPPPEPDRIVEGAPMATPAGFGMGFAAGGRIVQRLYADPYGFDSWLTQPTADLLVYVVNSDVYQNITGRPPPPTPVSAEEYTKAGLPWFELYDEARSPAAIDNWLQRLKTLGHADPQAVTPSLEMGPGQVKGTRPTQSPPFPYPSQRSDL